MTLPPDDLPEPPEDPRVYVGLEAEAAERQARQHGWTAVRVIPEGETYITFDLRAGRLNLRIEQGSVTDAWQG